MLDSRYLFYFVCVFFFFFFLNPAPWLCSKSWSTWLSKYLVFSSFILKSEFCNLGSLKSTHSLLGSDDWKKIIHIWYKGREEGMAIHSSILAWRSPNGRRSLAGYSSWGHKDSDTTEWLSTHKGRLWTSDYTSLLWFIILHKENLLVNLKNIPIHMAIKDDCEIC